MIVSRTDPETLIEALDRLKDAGYRGDFMIDGDCLKERSTGARFAPETLIVDETARFEGDSNPDDEAIVLAIRSGDDKAKGTLVSSYGPGVSYRDAKVMTQLRVRVEDERA